jgi:hypothetical protein
MAMSFNRLTWGVKASFRSYVEGTGGSIVLTDGATRAQDGTFVFAAVPGGDLTIAADGCAAGAMRFQGTVTFEAHGGMLKATLTELGLEAGTDGLVLTALDTQLGRERCAIAELGPVEIGPDEVVTLSAKITFDGMYQIADTYRPGTELDPLRLD